MAKTTKAQGDRSSSYMVIDYLGSFCTPHFDARTPVITFEEVLCTAFHRVVTFGGNSAEDIWLTSGRLSSLKPSRYSIVVAVSGGALAVLRQI
jgi:hypothetical protein